MVATSQHFKIIWVCCIIHHYSCNYLQMKCMVEVLGQPQDRLLNGGIYTHNFFKKADERLNELTWRLMVGFFFCQQFTSSSLKTVFHLPRHPRSIELWTTDKQKRGRPRLTSPARSTTSSMQVLAPADPAASFTIILHGQGIWSSDLVCFFTQVQIYPTQNFGEMEDRLAFVDLLKQLLHLDGRLRISAYQALNLPFITMTHITSPFSRA